MKLALAAVAALLLAVPAAAPVRYEAQGIRVGSELVSGAALQLKTVDASTLLVSASAVENLGADVQVSLDADHALTLQAGLRLERSAEGFVLRSHGPALVLEAAGSVLQGAAAVPFTLTAKGFDFGALGVLESAAFNARVAAVPAVAQDGIVSPERQMQRMRGTRASTKRRAFRGGNPFTVNAGTDREVFASLQQVSLDGSN